MLIENLDKSQLLKYITKSKQFKGFWDDPVTIELLTEITLKSNWGELLIESSKILGKFNH